MQGDVLRLIMHEGGCWHLHLLSVDTAGRQRGQKNSAGANGDEHSKHTRLGEAERQRCVTKQLPDCQQMGNSIFLLKKQSRDL